MWRHALYLSLIATLSCCFILTVSSERKDADYATERLPVELFDFGAYKRLFGKRYGSLSEELTRKQIYMSHAIRAMVAGIQYKLRLSTSYKSINLHSDRTPSELALLRNKVQNSLSGGGGGGGGEKKRNTGSEPDLMPELVPAGEEVAQSEVVAKELIQELSELDEKHAVVRTTTTGNRKWKSAAGGATGAKKLEPEVRPLPLERLVGSPVGEQSSQRRRRKRPPSNNPHFQKVDYATRGQLETPKLNKLEPVKKEDPRPLGRQVREFFATMFSTSRQEVSPDRKLRNQVFLDLRETGCFSVPRDQGLCGACYAFASVAMAEYLYCRQVGELIEFSEQYLVDCGKNNLASSQMFGCDGGTADASSKFIRNFGLELRQNYPYMQQEQRCPYDWLDDLKKVGYIRMQLTSPLSVDIERWPEVLRLGPLYVSVATGAGDEFGEYGGGVDQCKYCVRNEDMHAMVVIGHGRENGQAYWLLRNSFGPSWGQKGHWKLSKRAAAKFVHSRVGFMYGSVDGTKYSVEVRKTNGEQ